MPSIFKNQNNMATATIDVPKIATKVAAPVSVAEPAKVKASPQFGVPTKVARNYGTASTRRAKLKASMDNLEEGK